jgi:hypothetical protein
MNGIWTSTRPTSPCCHLSVAHVTKGATMDHMSCCHLLANQAKKGVPIKHCSHSYIGLQLHGSAPMQESGTARENNASLRRLKASMEPTTMLIRHRPGEWSPAVHAALICMRSVVSFAGCMGVE